MQQNKAKSISLYVCHTTSPWWLERWQSLYSTVIILVSIDVNEVHLLTLILMMKVITY